MKLLAFPAVIAVPVLAAAMLGAQPASAFNLSTRQCLDYSTEDLPAVVAVLPERGKLDAMRIQQETRVVLYAPTAEPADTPSSLAAPICPHGAATMTTLRQASMLFPEEPLSRTDQPDVFKSTALPVSHTPLDAKWQAADRARFSPRVGPWAPLVRSVSGRHRADQLQAVNQWVNALVRFTDDRLGKRSVDRWSGARATLLRGRGDCEDFAIAKMKLLEAVGISRADMFLVIAKDLVRRTDHALLVVRLDQRLMVLDNSTDQLLDAEYVSDYRPIFSYGSRGAWVHGYTETPVRMAAAF